MLPTNTIIKSKVRNYTVDKCVSVWYDRSCGNVIVIRISCNLTNLVPGILNVFDKIFVLLGPSRRWLMVMMLVLLWLLMLLLLIVVMMLVHVLLDRFSVAAAAVSAHHRVRRRHGLRMLLVMRRRLVVRRDMAFLHVRRHHRVLVVSTRTIQKQQRLWLLMAQTNVLGWKFHEEKSISPHVTIHVETDN